MTISAQPSENAATTRRQVVHSLRHCDRVIYTLS
jgi:hypothetical protein